jgi:hypothetical protein
MREEDVNGVLASEFAQAYLGLEMTLKALSLPPSPSLPPSLPLSLSLSCSLALSFFLSTASRTWA